MAACRCLQKSGAQATDQVQHSIEDREVARYRGRVQREYKARHPVQRCLVPPDSPLSALVRLPRKRVRPHRRLTSADRAKEIGPSESAKRPSGYVSSPKNKSRHLGWGGVRERKGALE
eukprot:3936514-Rhodomonas_salina.7